MRKKGKTVNKILIVEDEPFLNEMMCEYLGNNGFECVGVKRYDEALDLAYKGNFDLWIIDVKLIGGNGFELLSNLREVGKTTPAIFTTSLNTINDLQMGFRAGCDDYLKKPFELAELLMRVQNLFKREYAQQKQVIDCGDGFKYDINQHQLTHNGEPINLAKKECDLLTLFLKNRNIILSKERICSELWGYDEVASEGSLRVYIRNLRKIFGEHRIISKSKVGYMYV